MAKITKQKCNVCLKIHPISVDICDECGSTDFTPFSDREKVVKVKDLLAAPKAADHKLTKEAAEDVIKDDEFAVSGGNDVKLDQSEEVVQEAIKEDEKDVVKRDEERKEKAVEEEEKAEEDTAEESEEKELSKEEKAAAKEKEKAEKKSAKEKEKAEKKAAKDKEKTDKEK